MKKPKEPKAKEPQVLKGTKPREPKAKQSKEPKQPKEIKSKNPKSPKTKSPAKEKLKPKPKEEKNTNSIEAKEMKKPAVKEKKPGAPKKRCSIEVSQIPSPIKKKQKVVKTKPISHPSPPTLAKDAEAIKDVQIQNSSTEISSASDSNDVQDPIHSQIIQGLEKSYSGRRFV